LPRNFAAKRYFYDIDDNSKIISLIKENITLGTDEIVFGYPDSGEKVSLEDPMFQDPQYIENYLGRIEREIKPLFDLLEKAPENILDEEIQNIICIFLHAQYVRTEALRNEMDRICSQLSAHLKRMGITQEDLRPDSRFEDGKHQQIKSLLSLSESIRYAMNLRGNYNWSVGINNARSGFITSDNPARQIGSFLNDLCFPISRTHCILMKIVDKDAPVFTDATIKGPVTVLSEIDVVRHNVTNYLNANRYIFGSRQDITNYLATAKLINTYMDTTSDKKNMIYTAP
jgi:hypothetical protein